MSPAVEHLFKRLATWAERPAVREGERCLSYTQLLAEVAKRRDTAISRGVGMMTQIYADRALNTDHAPRRQWRFLGSPGLPFWRSQ